MGGIELNYPAHLRNQLLLQAQPPGAAAVCRRVKHARVRVDSEPVNRDWRQASRSRNPLARARLQHVDAEISRDKQIARLGIERDARDRLVAKIVVTVVQVAVCVVGS